MGALDSFINGVMRSGQGAAGVFGQVKGSGDSLADGFFQFWKK